MPDVPEDGEFLVPTTGDGETPNDMGDISDKFATLLHNQLAQTGNIAQNNFVTTTKFADFDYMEGKRIVDVVEALGVREIASKSVPAGPKSD